MSQEPRSGSWWLTVPGVLTGLAAVITAVTGLAIGLHEINTPSATEKASPEKPAAVKTQKSASSDTTTSQTPSSDDAAQESVALPAGMEAKLGKGTLVYKILSAHLEPYNAEKRLLRFTVRVTTAENRSVNFQKTLFRLLVDGVSREPTSFTSEGQFSVIVEPRSSKEGDVAFEVPVTENDVVLQIIAPPGAGSPNEETTEIPFDLTATEA